MRKYYVGLDVHKETIAIAVLDAQGKLVTRTVIETSTEAVRNFLRNLGGVRFISLLKKATTPRGFTTWSHHWSGEWWPVTQITTGYKAAAAIEWTR